MVVALSTPISKSTKIASAKAVSPTLKSKIPRASSPKTRKDLELRNLNMTKMCSLKASQFKKASKDIIISYQTLKIKIDKHYNNIIIWQKIMKLQLPNH